MYIKVFMRVKFERVIVNSVPLMDQRLDHDHYIAKNSTIVAGSVIQVYKEYSFQNQIHAYKKLEFLLWQRLQFRICNGYIRNYIYREAILMVSWGSL